MGLVIPGKQGPTGGTSHPGGVGTVRIWVAPTKLHPSKRWAPEGVTAFRWGLLGCPAAPRGAGSRSGVAALDEPAAALSCLQQLQGGGREHPRGKFGIGIKKRVSILGKGRLGRAKNVSGEAA